MGGWPPARYQTMATGLTPASKSLVPSDEVLLPIQIHCNILCSLMSLHGPVWIIEVTTYSNVDGLFVSDQVGWSLLIYVKLFLLLILLNSMHLHI